MKITITIGARTIKLNPPGAASAIEVPGTGCPECKAAKLIVNGTNPVHGDREVQARAMTKCCSTIVGVLRVTFDTIFGREEDDKVLKGRANVY